MLCQNLMTMHANWMCHALTQGIRITIKTFTNQVQKVLLLINLSQKTQETVSNPSVEITMTK